MDRPGGIVYIHDGRCLFTVSRGNLNSRSSFPCDLLVDTACVFSDERISSFPVVNQRRLMSVFNISILSRFDNTFRVRMACHAISHRDLC